jgi:glutamyl/glutaminyl-tRNA synthetase
MLLAPDRTKLSKRSGGIPIHEYRANGYLSDAVFNHLAFLGGIYPTLSEAGTRKDLIDNFDYSKAAPSACVYDVAKLESVNSMFLMQKSSADLQAVLIKEAMLPKDISSFYDNKAFQEILVVSKDGAKTLVDIKRALEMFVSVDVDNNLFGAFSDEQKELFNKVKLLISKDPEAVTGSKWKEFKLELPNMSGLKGGKLWKTLRVMLTGKDFGPPLDDIMLHMSPKILKNRIDKYV